MLCLEHQVERKSRRISSVKLLAVWFFIPRKTQPASQPDWLMLNHHMEQSGPQFGFEPPAVDDQTLCPINPSSA